jgi:S-adenosylmethionine hydrolase
MVAYDTITFLSDYGRTDEFVGIVHSVIRSIEPGATVIDLTHDITPYDVRGGGLALARSVGYLCPGVVLAVVDPCVGTERRAVAVEVGDGMSVLVGPDNGLLAPAVAMCGGASRAFDLTNTEYHLPAPGPTFAGRDIFAPVAAHLASGVPLTEVGTEIDAIGLLPGMLPVSHLDGDELQAEVLWVDRYGNAQLNLDPDEIADFGDRVRVRFGDTVRSAHVVANYAEVGPGEIGLVVDSYGLLSLVVQQGSAAATYDLAPATAVKLSSFDDEEGGDAPAGVTTTVSLSARPDRGVAPAGDAAPPRSPNASDDPKATRP